MEIAIVVVAYKRVNSLERLLNSLSKSYYPNNEITLIISIDKSDTNDVAYYAESFLWKYGKKIVDKHPHNLGLRNHIMSLGKWFEQFEAIVVLEDDVVVSPNYFTFTAQGIEHYKDDDRIAGLSLYSFLICPENFRHFLPLQNQYDVYLINWAFSWGQVWMKKQWLDFHNWYMENQHSAFPDYLPNSIRNWKESSWLKYHIRYVIENNKYFVVPYISHSSSCGDAGTHYQSSSNIFQVPLQLGHVIKYHFTNNLDDLVKYDGFFENKAIYAHLGYDENDLTIDLNGNFKDGSLFRKKYLLTPRKFDYKVIKSFATFYRPIEMNILYDVAGSDIFLYDVSLYSKNHSTSVVWSRYVLWSDNLYRHFRLIGVMDILRDFLMLLKNRL